MGVLKNISSVWTLRNYIKQLENYDYKSLYEKVAIYNTQNQYILKTNQFNRGKQYVKSFGLLGLSFQKLIKRTLTLHELESIILLSHLAPVYDDLFDKLNTPKNRVIFLLENPQTESQNEEEQIFLLFYRPLFQKMSNKTAFLKYFLKLTEAQENSKKQLLTNISKNEILKITQQKGGYSALLLFSLLDTEINYEKQLFQLGACCQFMDDIFDWHDDSFDGRKTIGNTLNLKELKQFYTKQRKGASSCFNSDFNSLIDLLLFPGNICLDFYERNGLNTLDFPKERIVCDMEKMENIKRLIFDLR